MSCKIRHLFGLLFLFVALASSATPQDSALQKFLQDFAERANLGDVRPTKYIAAVAHLHDDDRQQILVYLIGPTWCGSGGCTVLILVPKESSYTMLAEISVAQQPIRVLDTKSNGWHDLGVWVRGGGIQPGYEAKLSFNGKEYPTNPTVPPAQRIESNVPGKVLVSRDASGIALYPK